MGFVNTVLGPIHEDELGVTAAHEHILWGPPGWEYDPEWWFNYPKVFSKCLGEINEYSKYGGKTIVDCSGIGMGRDIELYSMLSKFSGVNIVVGTGFWIGIGVYNYFQDKSIDYMEDLFVRELTQGIRDTGVKAGYIKVGNGNLEFSDWDERQYRAAARASKRTGSAIITHGISLALQALEILESESLDLSRVIISHADAVPNFERDKAIATMGAWVSFDHCTTLDTQTVQYYSIADELRADMIKAFIEAGFLDQVIISADVNLFSLGWSRSSPLVGKATTADLLRRFPKKLKRIGIGEDIFWKIMTENPKKVLPIR